MCECKRVIEFQAKCSDLSNARVPHLDLEHDGYVISIDWIGGGDYVDMTVCLDCGKIRNFKPLTDEDILGLEEFEEAAERRREEQEEEAARLADGAADPHVITALTIEKNRVAAVLADAFGKNWKSDEKVKHMLQVELAHPEKKTALLMEALKSFLEEM